MFRRANKITSLLVVAASVTSMVPAGASIKLTNLNGYLNNAIAFDGGYVYSGYKDSDETGIYYYKYDDEDKLIEGSEYDLSGQYGNQYGILADSDASGDDELLNLSSGDINDNDLEDQTFDAKRNLQKKLKKTNKYDDISTSSIDLTEIENGAKTGEIWYKYVVETTSAAVEVGTTSAAASYGYTNAGGNYVDVSNIANIYAYSSEENKMVKIDGFDSASKKGDGTDNYDSDTYLRAKVTTEAAVIAQDENYIYQKVNVDLYDYSQNAITPEGQTTVNFNLTSDNINASLPGQMTPTYGIYSLPYVAVRDFSTLTSGATYTFDTKSYIYTTDTTLANTSGNNYFCDMNTLKAKILANDSNFTTSTDFNGNSTIMDDRKTGTDSSGRYVFYPKIYVNTSATYNAGPTVSTTSSKTASYVTSTYPEYPFYNLDRGEIGNFTVNDNSTWKEIDNVFVYYAMKEKNAASATPSTMTRWPSISSSYDKIDYAQSLTTAYTNQPASSGSGGTGLLSVNPNVFNGGSTVNIGNKLTFTYNPIGTSELEYNSLDNLKQKLCKYLDNYGISSLTDIDGATYSYDSNYNLTLKFETGNSKTNANEAEEEFGNLVSITSDIDDNGGIPIFPIEHTYIQKISKAQGDTKDGVYAPNKVESYEITDAYDSEAASGAADLLDKGGTYTVVNGKLQYIQNTSDTKLTLTPIILKKDNVLFNDDSLPSTSGDFDKTKEIEAYCVEEDEKDQDDVDIAADTAYDTDVDGNVWALNDGLIYKYDGEKFREVYSCGTLYDHLNVYDKNNLVAWNTDGTTSYTSVTDGEKQTIDNASALTGKVMVTDPLNTTTDTAITANSNVAGTPGWNQTSDGNWYFCDSTGAKLTNKWCYYNSNWYYLKSDGIMATSWVQDSGKWYYLGDDGARKYGWVNVNTNWYLLNTLGDMATGWINDEGKWYYLGESGEMLYNTTVNGYNLGPSGEIVSSSWIN